MAKNTKAAKTTEKESMLFKSHRLAFRNGWSQVVQTPIASFVTCLIIAMTLLFTTSLLVSLKTFRHVADSLHAGNQVTFYLKNDTSEVTIRTALDQLQHNDLVRQATYTSPEQALRELTAQSEFKEVLAEVQNNPLPPVLSVSFNGQDQQQIKDLISSISQQPFVQAVHLDSEWFERLFAILQFGNRLTYLLTGLFLVGIVFIISRTIQEATSRNHQEMVLLELIGATTAYIRRPFLYVGVMLGCGSGILASLLLLGLFWALQQPFNTLLTSYSLSYPTILQPSTILFVLLCSTLIGWLGSWISFYKYANLHHN
jgi:cell division transport system permease protein